MGINKIIIFIMVFFMCVGAIDKIIGNKFGYGKAFEEGFMAMGPLALAMVGMLAFSPVLANILRPIIVPIYTLFGADPAMFASTILAYDMGGYNLAMDLANTVEAGIFSGLFHGSMMGVTIAFTIPFSLRMVEKKDHQFLAKGIMAGIITIPIGCLTGGLVAGFSIKMIIINLIPAFVFALLISIGLLKIPNKMIKGFKVFGFILTTLIIVATAAGIVEAMTGIVIIKGMNPIGDGFRIVGIIAMMLAGAFPMVHFIKRTFKKPLVKMGSFFSINEISAIGFILTIANSVPMFASVKDMDEKGKVLNTAFAVSASFMIAGNLGFNASVNENMVFPVLIGKLIGGISSILLADLFYKRMKNKEENNAR